jgi:uncharacterized delta-60 repeat protein
MRNLFLAAITFGLFIACSSGSDGPPQTRVSSNVLGILEVRISGIGEGGATTASAQVLGPKTTGLRAKAVTLFPETGLSFTRTAVSFSDVDEAANPMRFTQAVFEVRNSSGQTFDNLTLYAFDQAGVSLAGGAMSDIVAANGSLITNPSVIQSMQPVHGVSMLSNRVQVSSSLASLQAFTPQEVGGPGSVQAAAISAGYLTGADQVLEYGFVASNRLGGRELQSGTGPCTNLTCGHITLAYRFPRLPVRASNPWAFVIRFLIANDTRKIYTQSIEEQRDNTVAGRTISSLGNLDEIRTLVGSGLYGEFIRPLCTARYTRNDFLPYQPSSIPTTPGKLDLCFGSSGSQKVNINPTAYGDNSTDFMGDVGVQSDGKIVLAGTGPLIAPPSITEVRHFALVRLFPDGRFDTTFGDPLGPFGKGKVVTALGTESGIQAITIQADDKIIAAGSRLQSGSSESDIAVARYTASGDLDPSFGVNGKLVVPIAGGVAGTPAAGSGAVANKVHLLNDGSIILSGRYKFVDATTLAGLQKFVLVKLTSSGALDSTFGTGGVAVSDAGFANIDDVGLGVMQANGQVIMVGHLGANTYEEILLCRFKTDGLLGTKFKDGSGCVQSPSSNGLGRINALALQADGSIIGAGGVDPDGGTQVQIGRWSSIGNADTTFSGGTNPSYAHFRTLIAPGGYGAAQRVLVQGDDKIVLSGVGFSNSKLWLARLNSDGSTETLLSNNAKNTGVLDGAAGLVRQPDGKYLVAGTSSGFNGYADFAVLRVNP